MIILDTNVLSELMKPAPSPEVVEWIGTRAMATLYTTAITQAEILHGIMLLAAGRRRRALAEAAAAMFVQEFEGRVLAFDRDAAPAYAQIAADRRRLGRPISHFDAQIAAIARATGAALATRNLVDFTDCGVSLLNPWQA